MLKENYKNIKKILNQMGSNKINMGKRFSVRWGVYSHYEKSLIENKKKIDSCKWNTLSKGKGSKYDICKNLE